MKSPLSSYEPTVFVVDDDAQARASVCALVRSMGLPAEAFASGEEFLAAYQPERNGCLVTDVRMYGMSGVELQEKLRGDGISLPVIVLTAFARTPLTVRVMQNGAVTLLEKPYAEDELWNAIRQALSLDAATRAMQASRATIRERISTLTPKETAVMELVLSGRSNRSIARQLEVSERTVENRRQSLFRKMQADSVAELVRMAITAGDGEAVQ